jgi:hypothetical protein
MAIRAVPLIYIYSTSQEQPMIYNLGVSVREMQDLVAAINKYATRVDK